MSRTKPAPAKEFPSRLATSPVSVRFERAELDWIERESAKLNYSSNRFIIQALKGIRQMIETPEGQTMQEPEVVALARFIRKPIVGSVLVRRG